MKPLLLRLTKQVAQGIGLGLSSLALCLLGLALNHRTPPPELTLTVEGQGKPGRWPNRLTLMTWNLGYAGMGEEADFFMDGGHDVLAKNKPAVLRHLENMISFLRQHPEDIYLLQEVDSGSRRTYYVNELGGVRSEVNHFYSSYAVNYDVLFVPYPFTQPLGRIRSGLLSLGVYKPATAVRLQLPGSFSWPVSAFNLDRCLLEWRLPREDGKEWVVFNVHLSAWDAGGSLRKQELAFLKDRAVREYERGNYVIIGGDWNSTLPGVRLDQFPSKDKPSRYIMTLPEGFSPNGWIWGLETFSPTHRLGRAPYKPGETYVTVIDGFLVSPNVQVLSVTTLAQGFRESDHEPVAIQVFAP